MAQWPFAPVKSHIKVYAELPQGIIETNESFINHREARGWIDGEYKSFYFCSMCKGWIEGFPAGQRVETLGILSGRRGHSFRCERCGYELSFMGIVA